MQNKLADLEEQFKKANDDEELNQLKKELEKKKLDKENMEKEAVAALAQLVAIEAVLINQGIIQVQGGKPVPKEEPKKDPKKKWIEGF